jgi:hypothetical protein
MSLSEFFTALDNDNAVVTIIDDDNKELVKVYASGSDQLLATLLARNVAKFKVSSPTAITVELATA